MGEVNVAVRRSHQTKEAQSAERLRMDYDENHGSASGPSSQLRERHV